MKEQYGVVLIGCGYIGEDHLSQIYYQENVHVVAVVAVDLERARFLARKYGVEEFGTDYKSYLTREDVDVVIIATYVDSHLPIMKACVEAGKHLRSP